MMDKITQEAIGGFAIGVGAVAMLAPLVALVLAVWAVHKLIERIYGRRSWDEEMAAIRHELSKERALRERHHSEIAAVNRVLDDVGVDDLDQGQPLATARRVRLACDRWVRGQKPAVDPMEVP